MIYNLAWPWGFWLTCSHRLLFNFGLYLLWLSAWQPLIYRLKLLKLKGFLQAASIGLILTGLMSRAVATSFLPLYAIFFTALLISVISDLQEMLILRPASLYLIPLWLGLALFGHMPISFAESLLGLLIGYGIPRIVARIYKAVRHFDGLGLGDIELFGMIGTFVGGSAMCYILIIANLCGIIGFLLLALRYGKAQLTKHQPFAPAITLGTLIQLFFNFNFLG